MPDAILCAVLAQFMPDAARDVLIAPFAIVFVAVLLFWTGSRRGRRKIGGTQILGLALGALATFFGARHLWNLWGAADSGFYRAALVGRGRLVASHYVAFAVPLTALLGMAFVVLRQMRAPLDDDLD